MPAVEGESRYVADIVPDAQPWKPGAGPAFC